MATYGNIPTGYVDDGPLGALWAGQNANAQRQQNQMADLGTLMDYMTKGQAYQQSGRMNPLLIDEKLGTNQRTNLENALTAATNPDKIAVSRSSGMAANAEQAMPGYFTARVQGAMDEAKGKSLEYDTKKATNASDIAAKIGDNNDKLNKYMADFIPSLMGMSPVQAAAAVSGSGLADHQKQILLQQYQTPGGLKKMLDAMSNTPTTMAAERLQKQKDSADMARTIVQANARIAAAVHGANAAIAAANKGALSAVLGNTHNLSEQLKASVAEINSSIETFKPEDKQSERYRSLVKHRDALQTKLNTANDLTEQMTQALMGAAPAAKVSSTPDAKSDTIPNDRTGKSNPVSKGVIKLD
jgi:inosine/xanthosine triphosphate pyrophosphatase family protein